MCANGGKVKLGDDPQPPAVTNQGATLFLKEGFERTALAPVICVGSFSPHLFSIQPVYKTAGSSQ